MWKASSRPAALTRQRSEGAEIWRDFMRNWSHLEVNGITTNGDEKIKSQRESLGLEYDGMQGHRRFAAACYQAKAHGVAPGQQHFDHADLDGTLDPPWPFVLLDRPDVLHALHQARA